MLPAARIEGLKRHYRLGDTIVRSLDGVSAEFGAGEFQAITGPSGSGKSTLLNLLGCLDRPTEGKYWIGDTEIGGLDDDELSQIRGARIGFIFQSFNLIPQLSIVENVEVPLFYQGWRPRDSRARAVELITLMGLGHRLKHYPTELSGGQQQRVAIARALACDPPILLADEPTGNLDSKTAREILDVLMAFREKGKTLIMVTHDESIALMADKRMSLSDGRIDDRHPFSTHPAGQFEAAPWRT
uniref:Putative ABC transport system ATP-binding protein n=1 Tax=Candidatus Kentrum sp. UNK TaxID=2126344 RepID=A0A451AN79_9GAMM|nr:MAG: putative ABC transport system ATP-binding protein [Candidatus Kentron sp. UNK]VFK72892.1 MAG: putative ABC transport system ATP-binding protein [Candidatus Kentron sp. UNK]